MYFVRFVTLIWMSKYIQNDTRHVLSVKIENFSRILKVYNIPNKRRHYLAHAPQKVSKWLKVREGKFFTKGRGEDSPQNGRF